MPNQRKVSVAMPKDPPKTILPCSSTGIDELDGVLGGGFPKESVVLLSGSSGSGKTIFCFQWLYEGIRLGENGVYISATEPLFKSVKNIETLDFYDRAAIEDERLKIIDIREIYGEGGFDSDRVLNFIEKEVIQSNAKRLCIDSITAIAYNLDDKARIRKFIFDLGKILSTLGCTAVLTSEVLDEKKFSAYGVEEFISDGIIKLEQLSARNEIERTLQIIKMRGRGYKTEVLPFKITGSGICIFPRISARLSYLSPMERISTGNRILDDMILGGLFVGSSTFIIGSSGTGKSLFGLQFLKEGLDRGEPCLYAGFEESKDQIIRNAKSFGWDLAQYEKTGLLTFRCIYPSQVSIDEHMSDIKQIVESKAIKRCFVDSLSSIYNSFDYSSFIRFVKALNGYFKYKGVTSFFTSAGGDQHQTGVSEGHVSAIFDNIFMLRNVEMNGELRPVLNIIKVRGSAHSKGLRRYDITDYGISIGQPLVGYEGITTGVTRKVSQTVDEQLENEFKRYIGPMGVQAYREVSRKGITPENLSAYIDSLASQNIMKRTDANDFKMNALMILKSAETAPLPAGIQAGNAEEGSAKKPVDAKKRRGVLGNLLGGE